MLETLQEELGIKLKPTHAVVSVLIVEHVERAQRKLAARTMPARGRRYG